jgi:hypothetical protein
MVTDQFPQDDASLSSQADKITGFGTTGAVAKRTLDYRDGLLVATSVHTG